MMDICHYTFVPNHRMYSKVNYGLWVNPWFKKQCSALVEVFNNEGSCVCTGVGSIWEISGSSSQFYCKPKTSLKAAHTPSKCQCQNFNPGIRSILLPIIPSCSHSTQKESLKQSYADKPEIRPGQYYKTPVRCSDLEVWWFPHPS